MSEFNPKIVAFVCNWCTYAGADLTGTSRMKYSPQVSIIRFPCTGRIDFMLLLKAFANGADGIIVSGCHPNDCHYSSGNFHARRRWIVFRGLLDFLGIDVRRVQFSWVSAAEGAKWAQLVNATADQIRQLGPFSELSSPARPGRRVGGRHGSLEEQSARIAGRQRRSRWSSATAGAAAERRGRSSSAIRARPTTWFSTTPAGRTWPCIS